MKFPNVDSLPRSLLVGFLAELLFIECLIYLSSLGQLRAEGQQLETRHIQRKQERRYREDQKRIPRSKREKRERQAQGKRKSPTKRASRSRQFKGLGFVGFVSFALCGDERRQSLAQTSRRQARILSAQGWPSHTHGCAGLDWLANCSNCQESPPHWPPGCRWMSRES